MGPWAMPAWAVDQTAPHDATWFDTTHPPSNEFCWLTEKQQKALVPQLKAAIQKEPMAIVGIRTPQLSLFSAAVNAHTPPTAAAVLFRMARGVPSSWVADCVRHFPFLLQYVQGDGRTVDLIKAAGEKYPSVAAHYALNDVERAFIEQGAAGKKTTVPEWAKQIPERLEMAIDAVQRDWNVLAFVPPLFRTPPLLFLALEQDAGAIGLFTDAEQCAHPAWVMRAIETLSYEIIFVAHPTPDQVDKAIDDNPALVALIPKAYHTLKSAHKAAEAGLETLLFMDPVRWGQVFVDRYGVAPCMACLE